MDVCKQITLVDITSNPGRRSDDQDKSQSNIKAKVKDWRGYIPNMDKCGVDIFWKHGKTFWNLKK